jgi:hypothetical protein
MYNNNSCAFLSTVPLNIDENGDMAPRILNLSPRWRPAISFRSQSLYSRRKNSGGFQGLPRHFRITTKTNLMRFPCTKLCFVGVPRNVNQLPIWQELHYHLLKVSCYTEWRKRHMTLQQGCTNSKRIRSVGRLNFICWGRTRVGFQYGILPMTPSLRLEIGGAS